MIYTLCIDGETWMKDIKVNPEQKIKETIQILIDGNVLPKISANADITLFSERKGEFIDMEKSYIETQIFQGDILQISYEQ